MRGEYAGAGGRLPRSRTTRGRSSTARRSTRAPATSTARSSTTSSSTASRAERWLIVCNASNRDKMAAHFRKRRGGPLRVRGRVRRDRAHRAPGPEGARRSLALAGGDAAEARASCKRSTSATRSSRTCAAPSPAPATPARTASRSSARRSDAPALWRALLELGAAARPRARRPRRARHAAPRGAALALRQRHRRDDEPARGGPRLGREARQGRLRRARGARADQGRGAARASSSASR